MHNDSLGFTLLSQDTGSERRLIVKLEINHPDYSHVINITSQDKIERLNTATLRSNIEAENTQKSAIQLVANTIIKTLNHKRLASS